MPEYERTLKHQTDHLYFSKCELSQFLDQIPAPIASNFLY